MCKLAVIDFETASLDPGRNQPVSIGAIIIDPRKLTICEQGSFYSLINIIPDEEVDKYNLDKLDQKSLDINKLKLEDIQKAPPLRKVWGEFSDWIKFHTTKKDEWSAPIFCGHNIAYDMEILRRIQHGHLNGNIMLPSKLMTKNNISKTTVDDLAKAYKALTPYKEPWKYGPEWLFNPSLSIDTMQASFMLFENCRDPSKMSLGSIKDYLGFKENGAHNALNDALFSAELLVRYIALTRQVYRHTDFACDGKSVLPINDVLNTHNLIEKEIEECPF